MSNPFDSGQMAAGYARSRPAIHVHIVDRLRVALGLAVPVERALDVGCGAGLSTAALGGHARRLLGIDPSHAMLRHASASVPAAHFVAAVAEALPVRERSIDLMTAAGSLNWVDLPRFFAEVTRVLTPGGTLAIYDFAPGREFRGDDRLSTWFAEFARRYPPAAARAIVPEALELEPHGLRLRSHEPLVVGLVLDPGFYLDYVMTETNVAEAVRAGASRHDIREWCRHTLAAVFPDAREVLFRAYLALVRRG
jgi:ubiquinone/menaquinone biosynthesis C-methylase UbiE